LHHGDGHMSGAPVFDVYFPRVNVAHAGHLGHRGEPSPGVKEHDEWMVYLKIYPEFDNLRVDPRFQNLHRRVGLL
jgi:hypothetical protein